jgi:DNA integrity scanning protein DisA with diadenylate cyclase activity
LEAREIVIKEDKTRIAKINTQLQWYNKTALIVGTPRRTAERVF